MKLFFGKRVFFFLDNLLKPKIVFSFFSIAVVTLVRLINSRASPTRPIFFLYLRDVVQKKKTIEISLWTRRGSINTQTTPIVSIGPRCYCTRTDAKNGSDAKRRKTRASPVYYYTSRTWNPVHRRAGLVEKRAARLRRSKRPKIVSDIAMLLFRLYAQPFSFFVFFFSLRRESQVYCYARDCRRIFFFAQ